MRLAGGLSVVPLLLVALWSFTGGSWFVVQTPSMGTWSPVGTMVWVHHVAPESLRVGDVITFHPPAARHETYTHRIVAVNGDHTFSTKGDINGATDPWRLNEGNIVGRTVARWWYVGWLVKAFPLIAAGVAAIWILIRYFTPPALRMAAAVALLAMLASLVLVTTHMLFGAKVVTFVLTADGARVEFIGTGILPVRVTGSDGGYVTASAGQLRQLTMSNASTPHEFVARLGPAWHVPPLVLIVAVSLGITLLGLVLRALLRGAWGALRLTATAVSTRPSIAVMPEVAENRVGPSEMTRQCLDRISGVNDQLTRLRNKLDQMNATPVGH